MEDYKTEKEFLTKEDLRPSNGPKKSNGQYHGMNNIQFLSKFKQHLIDTGEMVPADQWISVKDSLPEKPGFYLVMKHFNMAVDEYLNETKKYHQAIIFYFKERNVTGWQNKHDVSHWQTLPSAPGEHNTKS